MTILTKTKFLEFKVGKSPSNHDWYYIRRCNDTDKHDSAVVITTLVKKDNEYNFLFLKTKRPPLYCENKSKYCLESPAGLIGDENSYESLEECIKKELLEETGLSTDNIYIEKKNCSASSGLSSETLTFVTAIVDEYIINQKPVSDGGIIAERFFVKTSEIDDYLKSLDEKYMSVASATVAGIYWALKRI